MSAHPVLIRPNEEVGREDRQSFKMHSALVALNGCFFTSFWDGEWGWVRSGEGVGGSKATRQAGMGQFRCCATFQWVLRYFKINLESPNNRPPFRRNQPKWSDHSALKNRKQINKQQYNERRLMLSCWHIVSLFSECAYIEIIFGLGVEKLVQTISLQVMSYRSIIWKL